MTASVIVLGGGIIGLSCAFEAARRRYKVTLLEPYVPGGQASGAAAGMLAPYSENTEQPDDFFRLCVRSLRLYPDWVRDVEQCSAADVEWVRSGSLNVFQHEADLLPLQARIRMHNQWGAEAELVSGRALRELEPKLTDKAIAAVYTPEESHVYAPKLVEALLKACRRLGVDIRQDAGELERLELHDSGGATVKMRLLDNAVACDKLVVCSGAWSGQYERWIGIRIPIHPIRGQICSYGGTMQDVRHIVMSSQAYWVGKRNDRIICGASEDVAGFRSDVTDKGISRLIRSSGRWFPHLSQQQPLHRWAGLRPATVDGRPLLGPVRGNRDVIMAAGHYRNGILLSPVTAMIVGDLLDGRESESIAGFLPERFTERDSRPNQSAMSTHILG
ncbi:glycine oxidase ThiO [Paenibacillus sp. J5C_2022]|uniref:glycine oxidase ThiO n=1 Tax=Paenibacillus sp. J5C2022 TaxID=2977129 RepID=UPI0021D1CC00|nr:glycine oxidase ThiO [Paenibacillus sp. J5C2022]MCU6710416.1 glycine oxidase ThiO [Paenibacillus sp. J5C2022]